MSYRGTRQRHEMAEESARQRGLAMKRHSALVQPHPVRPPSLGDDLFALAIDSAAVAQEFNREQAERQQRMDAQAELHSEGRIHRNTRPQTHE